MPRKATLWSLGVAGAVGLGALLWFLTRPTTQDDEVLRVLAWVGYDEPDFLDAIKSELDINIEVKTYVGGDQMYTLFKQAPPGTYDVVVVDAEYGQRMFNEGLLWPLDRGDWYVDGLFAPFDKGEPVKAGDNAYAAVARWGSLGLVFNSSKVTSVSARSYGVLWDPAVKGRVGIFDWYLPNMGVLSRYLKHPEPFGLDEVQLTRVKERLFDLRPQVRSIHSNTGDVINDFRTGEIWICPGIGEWAAALLKEEKLPIEWVVPDEGGVMWVEAFAIPSSAQKKELSRRLIRTIRSPQNMARLAWRKAYVSQMPLRTAYEHLSADRRQLLRSANLKDLQGLIDRLVIRRLPGPSPLTTELDWTRVWTAFKAR